MAGKTGTEAFTNVDLKSIAISGVAGAATMGLSAIGGKGAQIAISTSIDAGESVANQLINNQSVSVTQTVSDVVANKVGGAVAKRLDGALGIKTAERQLSRAERVSAGDPSSSGRAQAVTAAKSSLDTKNAVKQAAGGVVGNTAQSTSNTARSGGGATISPNSFVQQDNTKYNQVFFGTRR